MQLPLRYQFLMPLLLVAGSGLAAIGLIHSERATARTKAQIEKRLHRVLEVLTASTYPLTDSVLAQMGGLAHAEFVLTDRTGTPIASGTNLQLGSLLAETLVPRKIEDFSLGAPVTIDAQSYFLSTVSIKQRANLSEPALLHILFPQSEYDSAWREAFLPPVTVGIATLATVALVVHLVAGRVSKTLNQLGNEVERLADGDFSKVALPKIDDETRDLAHAINRTAVRLANFETELRQTERLRTVSLLGAGLAHEMRNAATGCRLAVDLHAEDCTTSANDESLSVARRQLALMESRLQQLLQMGQTPEDQSFRRLDLPRLVSEVVALVKPTATHAKIALSWQSTDTPIFVQANEELLSQAIVNLLINAIDAAAQNLANGIGNDKPFVRIDLEPAASSVCLTIVDSGAGPVAQGVRDPFEPFASSKSEGVGLGLAVSKRIIESTGGKIDWSHESQLTKFLVTLPRAKNAVSQRKTVHA